ncbi:hypothetical protein LguiB_010622 [Lonicera macranthoides]
MMIGFIFLFISLFFLSMSSLLSKKRAETMASKRTGSALNEEFESRAWNNLPTDILSEIIGRLHFRDRIRFRATCKSWQLAQCDRPASKLPWLLTHNWNWDKNGYILSICKYHDPSTNQTFTNTHKIEDESLTDIFGASVCASKYGWLLLQRSCNTFLYSPYTKEIVKLPNLEITFNRSTFSSNPNSPDCIFFALQSSKSSPMLRISICQRGDLEWKTHTFDGFRRVIEDVVYSNGVFYCVFSGGVLGAFFGHLEWKLLTNMEPITGISIRYRLQMVVSDGEILLVCPSTCLHIFRFDWSLMGWVEQDRLGNKALFLGCTSFSIVAEEEILDLKDKIYYHGDTACFYSLETRLSQLSDFYPRVTPGEGERIWINPPQF